MSANRTTRPPCSKGDCTRTTLCRNLCAHHYRKAKRAGEIQNLAAKSPQQRFWAKVDKTDTCWLWTAATNGLGYGVFALDGKMVGAHRLALEWQRGCPIPSDMVVDHRCRVTLCVNPEHLQAVTVSQNGEHRGGAQRNTKTGVRGVFWKQGRFEVQVTHRRRQYYGGRFVDLEPAIEAARELRNHLMTNNLDDRATGGVA